MSLVIPMAARIVWTWLRMSNRHLQTMVLSERHVAPAAALLSAEFCRREPLCKVVGLTAGQILPFFQQLLAFVAAEGLGIVACDEDGAVRGVVTVEDHWRQFAPDPALRLPDGLNVIGTYLEQIKLPADFQPAPSRRLYYCGLAAVDSGPKTSQVLPLMILVIYFHLKGRGYTHGYAKVTNRAITRRFRRLERYAFTEVFVARDAGAPAAFSYQGRLPFAGYDGRTFLVSWGMG